MITLSESAPLWCVDHMLPNASSRNASYVSFGISALDNKYLSNNGAQISRCSNRKMISYLAPLK